MATNVSTTSGLPPLPAFSLEPQPPLIPSLPDKYLTLILPILAYWALSMVFHFIDTYDLFSQYRLHTPAEVLKRNHVSRWEVVRDVVVQQVVQTAFGIGIAWFEPQQMTGKDDYNVAVWAQRLRIAQRAIPGLLGALGFDSLGLAQKFAKTSPAMAGALSGGHCLDLAGVDCNVAFSSWEINAGKALYWIIVPAFQFCLGIMIVDTWQYFLHRAMHMNKWLYTTFHSRHHRLYVPYAYGALYNHPFEGFLLDTLGTGLAYLLTDMSPRQSMWFFTGSTIKTVDDHCGYALPWDPLQQLTSNNAGYHDVHHQSWGIKTNFSQPFFTFWDRALGTVWTGGDVSARYERAKLAAQNKADQDRSVTASNPEESHAHPSKPYGATPQPIEHRLLSDASEPRVPTGKAAAQAIESRQQILYTHKSAGGGPAIMGEETAEEEKETRRLTSQARRSPRKKTASSTSSQAGSLKGLRDRVSGGGSFHGRTGSLLGYETGA